MQRRTATEQQTETREERSGPVPLKQWSTRKKVHEKVKASTAGSRRHSTTKTHRDLEKEADVVRDREALVLAGGVVALRPRKQASSSRTRVMSSTNSNGCESNRTLAQLSFNAVFPSAASASFAFVPRFRPRLSPLLPHFLRYRPLRRIRTFRSKFTSIVSRRTSVDTGTVTGRPWGVTRRTCALGEVEREIRR